MNPVLLTMTAHQRVMIRGGGHIVRKEVAERREWPNDAIRAVMKRVKRNHTDTEIRQKWRAKLDQQMDVVKKNQACVKGEVRSKGHVILTYTIEPYVPAYDKPDAFQKGAKVTKVQGDPALVASVVKEARAPAPAKTPPPKGKGKGSASAPASRPTLKKPAAKPKDKAEPSPQWAKDVLTECEKYGIDPNTPPEHKPSGMRKKIWNKVKK